MARIANLVQSTGVFTRTQTERLNAEVAFINAFPNVSDTLKQGIVNQIMNNGFLSAALPGVGLSDLLASNDLISDPLLATDYITQQTNFVTAALDKIIDPSLPTGISDVFSDAIQGFARSAISDGSKAAFESIQNRVVGTSRASAQQQLSNTTARNAGVIFGSPGKVQEVDRSIYDGTKKTFNKVFTLAGLVISSNPAAIFGLASTSITALNSALQVEATKLAEWQSLLDDIVFLTDEIASEFYDVADVTNTENSQDLLGEADSILITVRSKMLTLDSFDKTQFEAAKDKIEQASDALDQELDVNPKIAEINSKLDRLEVLLGEIAAEHNASLSIKADLEDSIDFWLQDRIFGSLFAGQINNVQTEIRSIIDSMTFVIANPRRGILIPLVAAWRGQLILILQTMSALPAEIEQYFDDDPEGFRIDLQTTVDDLDAITDFSIVLFVAQGQIFIDAVRRKLVVPVSQTEIEAFATAVGTEIAGADTFVSSVTTILDAHVLPSDETNTLATNLVASFENIGADRAAQILQNSDFSQFFTLTAETSSFTGALLSILNETIRCLLQQPGILRTGLEALRQAQQSILNVKRAEELLAITFGQFRDNAIDAVIGFDLPQIQQLDAAIRRAADLLLGGPCDV